MFRRPSKKDAPAPLSALGKESETRAVPSGRGTEAQRKTGAVPGGEGVRGTSAESNSVKFCRPGQLSEQEKLVKTGAEGSKKRSKKKGRAALFH